MTSTVVTADEPRRAGRQGRARERAWLIVLTVGCPLLLFLAIWLLSDPGDANTATLVVWPGSIVVLAVVIVAASDAGRCRIVLRVGCVAFTLAALMGLIDWTVSGRLTSVKLRGDVSSWQNALAEIHGGQLIQACVNPHPSLSLAGFGTISQVCATSPTSEFRRSITFLASPPGTELIFYPHSGLAPAPDECVRHLTGPWWMTAPVGTASNCPIGSRFEGGG